MEKEGVIKFNCNWINAAPLNIDLIKELDGWRNKLYNLGLIGENADGIGYGNISRRFNEQTFIISGSGTGKIKTLTPEHYTEVTSYDLEKNALTTIGPIKASSESLTHAAIYQQDKNINGVMHVHHFGLWKKMLHIYPTTNGNIEYGTPAMAMEIERMFTSTAIADQKIFVMAGHEEGIVSFGKDLDEAGNILLNLFATFS